MLASYRTGQKRYALSQAAQQVAADLRMAQNMAMSGVDIAGQYCGYGIDINRSARPYSYRFYADKSADCQTSNNRYDGSDDILETMNLPSGIKIQTTSPLAITVDAFFKPPDPTTYINGNSGSGQVGTVTLEIENNPSANKRITVTGVGRIQID